MLGEGIAFVGMYACWLTVILKSWKTIGGLRRMRLGIR